MSQHLTWGRRSIVCNYIKICKYQCFVLLTFYILLIDTDSYAIIMFRIMKKQWCWQRYLDPIESQKYRIVLLSLKPS